MLRFVLLCYGEEDEIDCTYPGQVILTIHDLQPGEPTTSLRYVANCLMEDFQNFPLETENNWHVASATGPGTSAKRRRALSRHLAVVAMQSTEEICSIFPY